MTCRLFIISTLLICLMFSCSPAQKVSVDTYAHLEEEIDSLLSLELFRAVQNKTHASLKSTPSDQYTLLSFLYNRLGRSYRFSYHFDSAVYYARMAYNLSARLDDKELQARYTADLLSIYSQSADYYDEQKKIFQILYDWDVSGFSVPVRALVLNALIDYYQRNLRFNTYLELPLRGLDLYKEYLKDNQPTCEDSVNIAVFCMDVIEGYAKADFGKKAENDIDRKKDRRPAYYFNMARKWIGNQTYPLAEYYSIAIYISFIEDDLKMKRPYLYLDSLVSLAKNKGLNLNDLVISAHITLCDNYYYFLENNKENTLICRNLVSDAKKYDYQVINKSVNYYLEWFKADLLIREKKYDSALIVFNDISGQLSKYFQLRQQLNYVLSVAGCYEGYGKKDSAITYYKVHAKLLDSLFIVNEDKIVKEAEASYQNKVKQEKINTQNTVIEYVNKQKFRLLIAILFASGFIIVLIFLYRKINRQNEKLQGLNRQLDEANKTKTKLFAIISHDFRSPINQVYQLLQLQRSKDIVINPKEKAALERQTQAAAASLLESMEELLIWSKTQMQSFNITNEKVNIYNVCCQSIDLLHAVIQSKQLQINLRVAVSSVIETDPDFLLTIVRNLLQNAIKASPEEGQIIIRYETDDEKRYRIRILNEGPAFTQEDYMQALSNTSNLLKGGLGLLIVDELSKEIGAGIFFGREGAFTYCDIVFEIY